MNKVHFLLFIFTLQLLNANLIDDFLYVKQNSNEDNFLQQSQFETNYIDKARVSIDQSHFSDVERDYTIRLYTKSFSELENEENIYNLHKNIYKEKKSIEKVDLIKDRYQIIIKTIYNNRLLHILLHEMNFKQHSLDMRKNSLEKESDIINLYTIKQSMHSTELEQLKYQQKHQRLLYKIQRILGIENLNDIRKEINQNIFLNPSKIINYLSENIQSNKQFHQNIFSKHSIHKIELAQERTKAEKIKENIKLDNIEVKFDDSKKSKNAFSVGLSIEIPIAKNSTDILEEQLKLLSIKNRIEQKNSDINDKVIELKQDINLLINYFKRADIQISKVDIDNQNNSYPIKFLLNIKKQNLKLEKEKAKTLYQMLDKYITLLYLTNRLENSNFRNILKNQRVY